MNPDLMNLPQTDPAILLKYRDRQYTAAEYSALLMNITHGKCYSIKEYVTILDEIGFESGNYQDTISDRGFLTAAKK